MRHALLALTLVVSGCDQGKTEATRAPAAPNSAAAPAGATPAGAAQPDRFGVPVTEPLTALASIAESPASFKGKTVATGGKVTKVCTHQGCWLALTAAGAKPTIVRMHDHAFFVPPNSSTVGRNARVQGTVMITKDGKECEGMDEVGAQLELDATGVELDPRG